GRPIANTRIHLLDAHGEPVAAGVPGELAIGGAGLARGYLERPALTAERFVPDPASGLLGGAGERLYRTGDLASFRPDGAIEFLGRLDHQVKVRGFRIELGEIEAALVRHAGVREAVVLALPTETGTRLVAYLVAAESAPADLRSFLAATLPEHMVPAAFVILPSLPLGPSGKVDRRALAAVEPGPAPERLQVAPLNALETRLAAIWKEVLGIHDISVDDNFFALGGDYIQGALFINRLQKELGEIVYVMALFEQPTVATFATYLEKAYPNAAASLGGSTTPTTAPISLGNLSDVESALDTLRAAVFRRLRREDEHGSVGPRAAIGSAPPPTYAGPPSIPGAPPKERSEAPRSHARPGPVRSIVFLLSPFRSGSTLLRVMLAGHKRLFAPPELELLPFDTLSERHDAYAGRNAFALEGLLRAVMELEGCDAAKAREIVATSEAQALPVASLYELLAEKSGRLLIDKTPSYALALAPLRRAEELFTEPLYIHLVRHPRATIESYLEARMDQVYDFPFPPAEQAELVWLLGHRNIRELLADV